MSSSSRWGGGHSSGHRPEGATAVERTKDAGTAGERTTHTARTGRKGKMGVRVADKTRTMGVGTTDMRTTVVGIADVMKTMGVETTAGTRTTLVVGTTANMMKTMVLETTADMTWTTVVEIAKAHLDMRKRKMAKSKKPVTGTKKVMITAIKRETVMTHTATLRHARKKPPSRTPPARKGRRTIAVAAVVVAAAVAVTTVVTMKKGREARRADPIREEAGERSIQHTVLLALQQSL